MSLGPIKQAIIIAGGEGTRLRSLGGTNPKALTVIGERTVLDYQLEQLAQFGFQEVVMFVGYGARQIEEHVSLCKPPQLKITFRHEIHARGTIGGVLEHMTELDEQFLIVYGDIVFSMDLERLCMAHLDNRAALTLVVHPNDHPYDSALISTDENHFVTAIHSYPHGQDTFLPNRANSSVFVMNRECLENQNFSGQAKIDLCKDLIPRLIQQEKSIFAYSTREYIKDMGTPKRLRKVERDLSSGKVDNLNWKNKVPAVFLDRDGTLTSGKGYIVSPSQLELYPGVAEAIKCLNVAGILAVLVTNQPVIARGDCTVEELHLIHNKLSTLLGQEGAYLDAIYFCPHHPDSGYEGEVAGLKIDCNCRKPKAGMLLQASIELNVDLERSWMIGDSTGDIKAGELAGVKTILVHTGMAGRDQKFSVSPVFESADLASAVEIALSGI